VHETVRSKNTNSKIFVVPEQRHDRYDYESETVRDIDLSCFLWHPLSKK